MTLQISIHQESTTIAVHVALALNGVLAPENQSSSTAIISIDPKKEMVSTKYYNRKLRLPTRLSVELLILIPVFIFTFLIFLIIFSIGYLLPKRFEPLLYLISCRIYQPVRI